MISRGAKTQAHVIEVHLSEQGIVGKGEAVPYARYGETVEDCVDAINSGKPFDELPFAARNAFDAAYLDLRAKVSARSVWECLGLEKPVAVRTAQTLSLGTADEMAKNAQSLPENALIKMKLGGADDINAVRAVRKVRPGAQLIVDANEGWSVDDYHQIIPELVAAGVEMIEQPFHADRDEVLQTLERPIAICADESVHTTKDLPRLSTLYDMINIKLDKTGGLSEALRLKRAAQNLGLRIMIGCMVGSSRAMAPAQLLAHDAEYVDLDGPLFLAKDVEPAIEYVDGIMYPAQRTLWG